MAGRAWVEGFLHRNPMIAARKTQNLNLGRAQESNPFFMNDHLAKFEITIEELPVPVAARSKA